MAHFAKIENNVVTQVIVINNTDCGDLNFPESEAVGQQFIKSIGLDGEWKQTSYNRTFRKHFASTNYTYNADLDAFIPPNPYPSWILNKKTFAWEAPIPMPANGKDYFWDEESKSWILEPDYQVS